MTNRLCTPGRNSSSNADKMLPPSVTFALAAVDLGVKESFQRQDESGFIGVVSRVVSRVHTGTASNQISTSCLSSTQASGLHTRQNSGLVRRMYPCKGMRCIGLQSYTTNSAQPGCIVAAMDIGNSWRLHATQGASFGVALYIHRSWSSCVCWRLQAAECKVSNVLLAATCTGYCMQSRRGKHSQRMQMGSLLAPAADSPSGLRKGPWAACHV